MHLISKIILFVLLLTVVSCYPSAKYKILQEGRTSSKYVWGEENGSIEVKIKATSELHGYYLLNMQLTFFNKTNKKLALDLSNIAVRSTYFQHTLSEVESDSGVLYKYDKDPVIKDSLRFFTIKSGLDGKVHLYAISDLKPKYKDAYDSYKKLNKKLHRDTLRLSIGNIESGDRKITQQIKLVPKEIGLKKWF